MEAADWDSSNVRANSESTSPRSLSAGPDDLKASLRLSIVVPVRNEARDIATTLDMLLSQDYPRGKCEILVVDGQSTDGTRAIVERYVARGEPVRLLDNPRIWSSAARNIGASAASGDVILIIDGHCELPDRQHFRSVAAAFSRSRADVIGRPQPLTVSKASVLQRAIALARASRLGHHPDSYIYSDRDRFVPAQSVGAAYRRDVFARVGMFDERFDACEDVDFNFRVDQLGLSCFLSAESKVFYAPRASLLGLYRQLSRYGRGRVRLARKHAGMIGWKSLAPAALLGWIAVTGILACFHVIGLWLLAASMLAYSSAISWETARILWRNPSWPLAWWLPWVVLTIHVSAGLGIWQESLFGPRIARVLRVE